MSKYTTEVRFICEENAGLKESVGYNDVETIIANSREKIFDFNYPIFDESYRSVLETKILKHYYLNEICEETVGLWKLRLNSKMNEIMPYYNQLYNSQLLEFNPLYTHNMNKEIDRTDERVDNMERREANTKLSYDSYSDTPQGALTNVRNETYLTNAEKNDVSTNGIVTNDNTVTTTEDYFEHIYGYAGKDASALLIKYRQTFLNIDMDIIKDLDSLFMQIW